MCFLCSGYRVHRFLVVSQLVAMETRSMNVKSGSMRSRGISWVQGERKMQHPGGLINTSLPCPEHADTHHGASSAPRLPGVLLA